MEAYHNLLASKSALRPSCTNKDKLLQTKLRDRELKAAHKADLNAQKERKAEINQEVHATLKAERLTHDTKRAARDRRYAQKKEHHAETGQECEHGIWRCKICFPHKTAKDGKRV